MALDIGYGFRRYLIDTHQKYFRSALPVYFRLKNFPDTQNIQWSQLGFAIAPTGGVDTGTTDILIDPPPDVRAVSVHNIGQSEGKLRFGATDFLISHTFVIARAAALGISPPETLWKQPTVLGLVKQGILYSIENIVNEQLGAETVTWILTCNANELK